MNFGIVQLAKPETHPDKLKRIFDRLDELIGEYKPDEMAIEAPFFGKNVQSMLKLGRAQGVAIAAALKSNVLFEEYTPRRIKQAVTGNGNASKEQVAAMLQKLLNIKELPKHLDATDDWLLRYVIIFPKGSVSITNLLPAAGKVLSKRTRSVRPDQFLRSISATRL